jgi:hypothetical protein
MQIQQNKRVELKVKWTHQHLAYVDDDDEEEEEEENKLECNLSIL